MRLLTWRWKIRPAFAWLAASYAPLLPGAAPPDATLAAIDAQFACPEAQRSGAKHMASLRAFFAAYAAIRPENMPTDAVSDLGRRLVRRLAHTGSTF